MTAVDRFSALQDLASPIHDQRLYRDTVPLRTPRSGQQYGFEVDLDACTGCKACVTACHRLNGLDPTDGETWRYVGALHGGEGESIVQRTVTAACHHCLDPACMKGCPVNAYEKDAVTGIVKHLDDQCIGCKYCTLTCPYEVPQFNDRLGIVRKCDMCAGRLATGEDPACVQACPSGAIAIRVVETAEFRALAARGSFLPGAPSPAITVPTTRYLSNVALPANTRAADADRVRPAAAHLPLVIGLVLTQWAAGTILVDRLGGGVASPAARLLAALTSVATVLMGLVVITLHLGRPLYAPRALLGLRTSWLSREILMFGLFAPLTMAHAALQVLAHVGLLPALIMRSSPTLVANVAAGTGLLAVFCSAMIYHATKKRLWALPRTGFRFLATTAVLGFATALAARLLCAGSAKGGPGSESWLALPVITISFAQLVFELAGLRHSRATTPVNGAESLVDTGELRRTALLLRRDLAPLWNARVALGTLGGVILPGAVAVAQIGRAPAPIAAALATLALGVLCGGELAERSLFFRSVSGARMPGQGGR